MTYEFIYLPHSAQTFFISSVLASDLNSQRKALAFVNSFFGCFFDLIVGLVMSFMLLD